MTDRVLVTGATGFLGGALTRRLLDDGHTVAVVQRPESPAVDARCTRIEWNGDATSLVRDFEVWKPQIVFHLATHFVSQHQTKDLPSLIDANVALGTTLLEACHKTGSTIVITGSSWQHVGGSDYHPFSLYAATKQALFDIAVYYKQVGTDVRELSFFDTYGPGDDRRKLISLLLDAAATGETLDMSSGHQLIDLLFVSDAVEALLTASRIPEPESIETARLVARSDHPLTVRDLVGVIEQVINTPLSVQWGRRPDRPNEMLTSWEFGNPVPGWAPRIDLASGIQACWWERSP